MKNKERAAKAEKALRAAYDEGQAEGEKEVWSSDIVDLLTDLRHYCFARRLSFSKCNSIAQNHFDTENKSEKRPQ